MIAKIRQLELLELDVPLSTWIANDPPLSAVSYRTILAEVSRLEIWPHPLTLGSTLPTLPFWLGGQFMVPVDLAASYAAACSMLKIV
jgi:hypothetical protein